MGKKSKLNSDDIDAKKIDMMSEAVMGKEENQLVGGSAYRSVTSKDISLNQLYQTEKPKEKGAKKQTVAIIFTIAITATIVAIKIILSQGV